MRANRWEIIGVTVQKYNNGDETNVLWRHRENGKLRVQTLEGTWTLEQVSERKR